jgi:hypothetical protein
MTYKELNFEGNKICVCPLAAHDTSYPVLITGSSAVGLALEMKWRNQSVKVSNQTGGKHKWTLELCCAMHFSYLPIIGIASRFGWTGPNLYYIFLTTKTKSLAKTSLVILTTKLTDTDTFSPFLRNLLLKSVQQNILLHDKNVSTSHVYADGGND